MTFTVSSTDTGPISSGINGYSALFDTHASTTPPETINHPGTGTDTTITSSSLTTNANWYFHVRAVDQAGNWGPTTTEGPYKIDVTPPSNPSITVTPKAGFSTAPATSITLTWKSTDAGSGIHGYDLSYDRGAATATTAGWSSTTTLLNLSSKTTKTITVATGFTYRFTVRAHDNVGKSASSTASVNIPVDSPALTHTTGWTTVSSANDFGGSALKSTLGGATISYHARYATGVAVLVTTCAGCGAIAIYADGIVQTVSTATSATHTKQILSPVVFPVPFDPVNVQIRVITSGKPVYIDGLAIQHA
jgi:predicted phage tail protein